MQKSSLDKLNETTKIATSRLKNVRKNINSKIGDNFSLGRSHEKKVFADYNLDRPQTVPANDELFQSISFQSPLSVKANNSYNLNDPDHELYEVPRKSISVVSEFGGVAPSIYPSLYTRRVNEHGAFEDDTLDKKNVSTHFERNTDVTQSMVSTVGSGTQRSIADAHKIKNQSESNLSLPKYTEHNSKQRISSSDDDEFLPCPNYPAPVHQYDREGLYGQLLKSIESSSTDSEIAPAPQIPPQRTKRRKEYEETSIRTKLNNVPTACTTSDNHSNRATVDSGEFHSVSSIPDDRIPRVFSRNVSTAEYAEAMEEKIIPSASRSESWSFYDATNEENSSPEPIYANDEAMLSGMTAKMITSAVNKNDDLDKSQETDCAIPISEPVYGALYDMESPHDTMLKPQAAFRKRISNNPVKKETTSDIIREFDPLLLTVFEQIDSNSNKSNELILLETLLGHETYGTTGETAIAESINIDTSDISDDEGASSNVHGTKTDLPQPPLRQDSLELMATNTKKHNSEDRKTVIIHQNMKLRSDSMEDILAEDAAVEPFLAKVDLVETEISVDLSRPVPSRSNWFVDDGASNTNLTKTTNIKAVTKKSEGKTDRTPKRSLTIPPVKEQTPDYAPPPYSEVFADPPLQQDDKPPQKSSMKSMFSNVLNKMENINLGIIRKQSFKGSSTFNAGKSEVKTIIEMIPKPVLTQRLIQYEGNLIRLPSDVVDDILKEQHMRKAFIRDRKFQAYFDKELKTAKENFSLDQITTIQCVSKHKFTNNSVELHCFEITTTNLSTNQLNNSNMSNPNMIMTTTNSGNAKTQRICHLYGVAKESDRFIWMQKLLESITDVFQAGYTCKFYRAGWCYLKVSVQNKK